MKQPSTNSMQDSASSDLPDFLDELQGDPWIELRWKRGLAIRFRDLARSGDQGGGDRVRGGRFAYQLSDRQRIGNAIGAPQAMVKIVRKGGASSRNDLVSQLSYLSREGELVLEEMVHWFVHDDNSHIQLLDLMHAPHLAFRQGTVDRK